MQLLLFGAVSIILFFTSGVIDADSSTDRSFLVDYDNDRFLKDGKPFQIIAGSFHYFRALPQTWRQKLRLMRAFGLNAVTFYIDWSLHNPRDGVYNWEGIADVEHFIRLAAEEDLYAIVRPASYISAQRENGGHPYWLMKKYPNIRVRTSDPDYLNEVHKWYKQLMPRLVPLLYKNGGPILLVQVENEYGVFGCDHTYTKWMKDELKGYTTDAAVLFTNDHPTSDELECGRCEDVFISLDLPPANYMLIEAAIAELHVYQKNGPVFFGEFYPGWYSFWGGPNEIMDVTCVSDTFRNMIADGHSVNFYMFYGGSNFGFTVGGYQDPMSKSFSGVITSYDFASPIDEAGNPTDNYYALRDTLQEFITLPNITIPKHAKKLKLPPVRLTAITTLLSSTARDILGEKPITSKKPLTFEVMDQYSGFVLYEIDLPKLENDPDKLVVHGLHDRALIYVDDNFVGALSRQNNIDTLPLIAGLGKKLQILVESQGRIYNDPANDFKGITKKVVLNDDVLKNWTITGFPFEDGKQLEELVSKNETGKFSSSGFLRNGPVIFHGTFDINENELGDTYVDTRNWGKGFIFINNFNLGRYWPLLGPQYTLYVPKEILKKKGNRIALVELQVAPHDGKLNFNDEPIFFPIHDHAH